MQAEYPMAPPLQISRWFNAPQAITLDSLRGRVVLLHAFQMLCPGCVSHGLPQTAKVHQLFAPDDVAVIGLHTVFEHHAVMTAAALEVFIHEYRLSFAIGIDQADGSDGLPLTMRAYGLRGTPSVVLLDRQGRIRLQHFGGIDDMALGGAIGQLVAESEQGLAPSQAAAGVSADAPSACDEGGCALP